jgi:hypothetical protein
MEHDRASGAAYGISPYARLSDAELRTAIRYTERLLDEIEQDHRALRSAYRDEIETMRSHFLDRLLARVIMTDTLITAEQRTRIEGLIGLQNIAATKLSRLVR